MNNNLMPVSAVVLTTLLMLSQASAAQYSLDSWTTKNVIASPFSENIGSGLMTGETLLNGDIFLTSDTFLGVDYSANWSINLLTSSITASNVSCVMSASAIAASAPNSTCNMDGVAFFSEGSTTAVTMGFDAVNNQLVLNWQTSDSLFSQYDFRISEVSQVPVPASVWLFGSALLGLINIKRK